MRTPGRTTGDSLNDVNLAIQQAQEKGYRIYCIGLNSDGNVDEAELAKISTYTNATYHIAADVNELPEFFNSIFADIDQSNEVILDEFDGDGNYRDVHFSIDNANVMEANIVILSSQQVEDVTLLDNYGNQVDLQNDSRAEFTRSTKYSLVKLIYPEMGDWTIGVKGLSGDHIKVGLIYNYDVNLVVEVDETSVVAGNSVCIDAYLASGGERMTDAAFYQNMTGMIIGTDENSGKVLTGELVLDSSGVVFEGNFLTEENTTYRMTVHVEGNGFYRDSDSFEIVASKNPPYVVKNLGNMKIRVGKTETVDLNEYFADEYGSNLCYSVSGTSPVMTAELADSSLSITANEKGKTELTIYADNKAAETAEQTVQIRVTTLMDDLVTILIPVFIILALFLAFFAIRKSRERLSGVIKVSIESCKKDQYGVAGIQRFEILNSIPLTSIGKRSFTIQSLLKAVQGYYTAMEYDQEKKEIFTSCINGMFSEAAKVKVRGSRKSFEIRLVTHSDVVKFVNMNIISDKKVLIVSIDDAKTFGIRFVGENEAYSQINVIYKKM